MHPFEPLGRPAWLGAAFCRSRTVQRSAPRHPQRGATMLEFTVVGSVLTLLGLGLVQYGLVFFAKNQMNHAAFMAARAASMEHASLQHAKAAYIKAMVPLYGGGRNDGELIESLARAQTDIEAHTTFELLNPTKESFADFNDPGLQATVGKGKGPYGSNARVIPQGGLSLRSGAVNPNSGQNIQDANLLKIRITQGYEPKLPLMKPIFGERIPIVTVATLHMQSDAIEPENPVSSPGTGNNGTPVDPNPPQPADPPPTPVDPPQTPASGANPDLPADSCAATGRSVVDIVPSDLLFDFDQSTIKDEGKQALDQIIEQAKQKDFESLTLTGYADPLGNDAHNQQLSLQRAEAARDYLKAHGFPNRPIDVEGKGSQNPVKPLSECPAGPSQISCLAPNRRVEFQFNRIQP
jgi:outer membrane protein OmpA-like peptidoglycan-associated protein